MHFGSTHEGEMPAWKVDVLSECGEHEKCDLSNPPRSVELSSEMIELNARGVEYQNPLFRAQMVPRRLLAAKAIRQSRSASLAFNPNPLITCLNNHRRMVSFGMALFCAIIFVFIPLYYIDTPSKPTTRRLLLVLFAGILQPVMVEYLAPGEVRKTFRLVRQFRKLHVLIFIVYLALLQAKRPPEGNEVNLISKKHNFGNCSIIDAPKNIPKFEDSEQEKERQFVYYNKSVDFRYQPVYDYEKATMTILDTLAAALSAQTTYSERCTKALHNLVFFTVFRPCNQYCQKVPFFCNRTCSAYKCIRGSTTLIDYDTIWGIGEHMITPIAKGIFERQYPGDPNFKTWLNQAVKYLVSVINDLLTKSSSMCIAQTELNRLPSASSCIASHKSVFIIDSGYHSLSPTCNFTRMISLVNGNKEQQDRNQYGRVRGIVTPEAIIVLSFYASTLNLLFLWIKAPDVTTQMKYHSGNLFLLSPLSKVFLIFLGIVALFFSYGLYTFSFFKFEEVHTKAWLFDMWKCASVYFLIGSSVLLTFTVGIAFFLKSACSHGKIHGRHGVQSHHKHSRLLLNNPIAKLVKLYQTHTRPRGGEWFIVKVLFWECFEIYVQISSLHLFASSKSIEYILGVATLLLLNMLTTPALFYKSITTTTQVSFFNSVILVVDTVIDTGYFGLNLRYLEPKDLYDAPFFGSMAIAWPVFCVMLRLRSLSRLVTIRYALDEYKERRRSSRNSRIHLESQGSIYKTLIKGKKFFAVFTTLGLVTVFTCVQFVTVVVSSVSIDAQCSAELGVSLWRGAWPKYTFRNGVFGSPVCAYDTIQTIHAAGKQLHSIPNAIGQCTQLRELDVSNNNIVALPRELLQMGDHLLSADFSGNPVAKRLTARNMSLSGGLPGLIVRHLNHSLESLDLSFNQLDGIDFEFLKRGGAAFRTLQELDVRYNQLRPDSMQWDIIKLPNLESFSVDGNKLAEEVDWSSQPGFQNDETEMNNGVQFLKKYFLPIKTLNLSHNGFLRNHFEDIAQHFVNLESLDISYNENIATTQSSPLTLLNLSKLCFFSVEGNFRIESIEWKDVEMMDAKMKQGVGKFIIKGIGWAILERYPTENTESPHLKNQTFPWIVIRQIRHSVVYINFQNVEFHDFDIENSLCVFPMLTIFSFSYTLQDVHMQQQHRMPRCLASMLNLTVFHLERVNITLPNPFETHSLETIYLDLDPSVTCPIFSYPNKAKDIRLEQCRIPSNRSMFVQSFAIPYVRLIDVTVQDANIEIPSIRNDFERVEIRVRSGSDYNFVGSVHSWTVKRRAILDDTNIVGPLFKLGADFECLKLATKQNTTTSFESDWNVTCELLSGNVAMETPAFMKCSIPSIEPSKLINIFCKSPVPKYNTSAKYNTVLHYSWECFEEIFLQTHTKCTGALVGLDR